MRIMDEPEAAFTINIVPMIDVIFSILAFFIISTLFLTRSEALDVNLPEAATAKVQKTAQINVSVQEDGTIALNRQPILLEMLQPSVRQLMEAEDAQSLVVVNADEQVSHGLVVTVMDQLRQIEGVKLAIAAEKTSSP